MWLFVVIKPRVCAYGAALLGDLHTAPLVIKPPPPSARRGGSLKEIGALLQYFLIWSPFQGGETGKCASWLADTENSSQQETQMMEHLQTYGLKEMTRVVS